ncbi:MAG: DUF1428 family protein [Leptolyngbyaceae cyanobacterium CSU_1_3]|nr:DUF1428 family protein [Leptolyngbyaceae cyanobacterium CSU_1_3]
MSYVDGFVLAVPTVNKEVYKQHAESTAKVMSDPRMQPEKNPNAEMPFDGKRMIYSGFEMIVDV